MRFNESSEHFLKKTSTLKLKLLNFVDYWIGALKLLKIQDQKLNTLLPGYRNKKNAKNKKKKNRRIKIQVRANEPNH